MTPDTDTEPMAAEPREMCDHICLLDDGHVDRGEPHFYGYRLPSPHVAETELAAVRAIVDGAVTSCELGEAIAAHFGRPLPDWNTE